MPKLKIGSDEIKRVHGARVVIEHDEEALEPCSVPRMQFILVLPLDHSDLIANWALAPFGPDRYKSVELQTLGRSGEVKHTWTLKQGFVHRYRAVEFPPESGYGDSQGNFVELVIRGVSAGMEDYKLGAILEVAAGSPEPAAGETAQAPPPQQAPPPPQAPQQPQAPPPAQPPQREEEPKTWIEIVLKDSKGNPVPNEEYILELPDGTKRRGRLDADGIARVDGIKPGSCRVSFPNVDANEWKPV
jgi:hypothetical protein